MTIEELYAIIEERAQASTNGSYTAELFAAGISRMAQKVGEEGVEVAIASMGTDTQQLAEELADLCYHTLVLMAAKSITPSQVAQVLSERHNS